MNLRHPRLILATAALTAALAATSCGSPSLNEGLGDDIDLLSSTTIEAEQAALAASHSAADATDALPSLKELSGWELDIELPIDKHIPLNYGDNQVAEDSYMEQVGTVEHEAEVGMGFNGEQVVPIYENVLGMYSEPGLFCHAMWGFSGLEEGLTHTASIVVHGIGDFHEDGGFYLAFSDYGTGKWKTFGPFKELGQTIELETEGFVNEAGRTYMAVIVYGTDDLKLRGMNIEVDALAQ